MDNGNEEIRSHWERFSSERELMGEMLRRKEKKNVLGLEFVFESFTEERSTLDVLNGGH